MISQISRHAKTPTPGVVVFASGWNIWRLPFQDEGNRILHRL